MIAAKVACTVAVVLNLVCQTAFAKKKTGVDVEIELSTKGDDIAFGKSMVQVPFSNSIKIKFKNEATPASEILHDIVIVKPGALEKVMKMHAEKNSYDRAKTLKMPEVLAYSKELKPGESDVVHFRPKKPGFYPFVCLMAGHGDIMGMKGVLNVKGPAKK